MSVFKRANQREGGYFGILGLVLHTVFVPLYCFIFVIIYEPFGLNSLLDIGGFPFIANLAIIMAIFASFMLLARTLLLLIARKVVMRNRFYAAWCVSEMILASQFIALYVTLMMGGTSPFFNVVRQTVGMIIAIGVFPYGFIFLSLDFYDRYKSAEAAEDRERASLVRFYDEYHKLKFIIASSAIVFLRSEENYVQIYYMDNQKLKRQILRSSLRALEPVLHKHGIVRCHRSYMINPVFVHMLRRDTSGTLVAELNQEGYEGIPVSKTYQAELTSLL